MVQNYDITVYQGSNISFEVTAVDLNGDAVNLDGYTANGYVRERYSDTGVLLDLTPSINPTFVSGIINVNVDSSLTANLPVTQGVYDIEIYHSGLNYKTKVIRGLFTVMPESTID